MNSYGSRLSKRDKAGRRRGQGATKRALPITSWFLVGLVPFIPGCFTLLGTGVGAAVDHCVPGPYAQRTPSSARPRYNDQLRLSLYAGRSTQGRYLGTLGPSARDPETYLLLERSRVVDAVPLSDVRALAVEVNGQGWLYGGITGAALDTAIVAFVVVNLLTARPDYGQLLGEFH